MKVVIDTSVVVSAILKDRDPEAVIMFVAGNPEFDWIASTEILAEYRNVLKCPKFALPEEFILAWEEMFTRLTTIIDVDAVIEFPRDPKDAKFTNCAPHSDAHYFITGDKDFSEAVKLIQTTIISVSQFKKLIYDAWN